MKYLIFCLFLTGCTSFMPNGYNQFVYINSGPYRGNRGVLISDCKSFETYKVRLTDGKKVCVKVWHMENIMQQKNLIEYYNEYSISTIDIGDDPEKRVPLLYFDCQLLGNYPKEIEVKHSAYRQRFGFLSNYGDHHVVLQLRFGLFNFRPTVYIRLYKSFTLTGEDIENYIRIRDARRSRRTSLRS